jgi:hypothetical protein
LGSVTHMQEEFCLKWSLMWITWLPT